MQEPQWQIYHQTAERSAHATCALELGPRNPLEKWDQSISLIRNNLKAVPGQQTDPINIAKVLKVTTASFVGLRA